MSGESSPDLDSTFPEASSLEGGTVPVAFIQNYNNQCAGHGGSFEDYSDYVLVFNSEAVRSVAGFASETSKKDEESSKLALAAASEALSNILRRIASSGLKVEAGDFGPSRVALFITCPLARIRHEYLASKINDYLHGIRVADIENLTAASPPANVENLTFTTAERLRLVHQILTSPVESGGAGISQGDPFVECLYPVHDRKFNRAWLKRITTKWRVDFDDLTVVKDHFGAELAYYFAFIDFYFAWLLAPAAFGLIVYLFAGVSSVLYGILNLGWATVFLEAWSRRQTDLAVRWEVANASRVEKVRPEFRESSLVKDPVTGELKPVLVSVPIVALLGAVLGVLPSLVYMVSVNSFSSLYLKLAGWLTAFENHRTDREHNHYLAQKVFVVNFLVSYLSIFLIAWVYIPYGDEITELLKALLPLSEGATKVGLARLQAQIFFYVVTSQAINFFTETVLPLVMRYGGRSARDVTQKAKARILKVRRDAGEMDGRFGALDPLDGHPGPLQKSVKKFEREYLELQPYSTYEDYAEMAIQFGYIVLFSAVFPLAPVVGFLNNWVELRSDFVKIVLSHRRLIPKRVENIGPWLGNMSFLVWLASIVNGLLIYQFTTIQFDLEGYHLLAGLVVAILWEHGWILFSRLVRSVSSNIPTEGEQISLKETFQLKAKLLGQSTPQVRPRVNAAVPPHEVYRGADALLQKNFRP
ncbi:hypothetical protein L0F63_000357 [Massospora cicadina]|nr:hypothetical protein L0F63_000357 [Massospora cicadina]